MVTLTAHTPSRRQLLDAIKQAILSTEAEQPGDPDLHRWGGMETIEQHLDALTGIAEKMETDLPEAYLAEVLDNVCAHCPEQAPSGYCPLRHINACTLYRCTGPIIDAIRHSLVLV